MEDLLYSVLNKHENLRCTIPMNAAAKRQRFGYPDLRSLHSESGRVFYSSLSLSV